MEIWKDIEGFEGCYQVSNLGRVRSLDHKTERLNRGRKQVITFKGKVLTPRKHTSGYLNIGIKRKNYYIHRLVAAAFIKKKEHQDSVNHIDGDKTNNSVENLEWCTHQENLNHAEKMGLRFAKGEANPMAKLKISDVKFIQEHYIPGDKVFGCPALAVKFGVSKALISKIGRKEMWVN